MLAKISKKMTSFFLRRNIITENEIDIYNYCFEVMLSTIINALLILIIALITHCVFESILYSVCFLVLRSYAGGYHAKSHIGCVCTLMFFYGSFLLMVKIFNSEVLKIINVVFANFSLLLVFLFAPVDSKNNPLDEERRLLLGKKAIISTIVIITVAELINFSTVNTKLSFAMLSAVFAVAISLIVGIIKNRINR